MKFEEIEVGARVRCLYDCPVRRKGKVIGNTLGKIGTIVKVDEKAKHSISGFYWVNDDSGQDIGRRKRLWVGLPLLF